MIYLLSSILVLFSYLSGVYFANQANRNAINRPLLYDNRLILFTLTILFGFAPLVVGLYLAFKDAGLIFFLILIIVRFLLLPTLLNEKIQSFMSKKGF